MNDKQQRMVDALLGGPRDQAARAYNEDAEFHYQIDAMARISLHLVDMMLVDTEARRHDRAEMYKRLTTGPVSPVFFSDEEIARLKLKGVEF